MKSWVKVFTVIALLVLMGSFPVAAQEHSMDMAEDAVEVNISLTDYNFLVEGQDVTDPLELQAGQVYQLHFVNNSLLDTSHEVLFGKDPMALDSSFNHQFMSALLGNTPVMLVGQMDTKDFMINAAGLNQFQLAPGQEITLQFTLPDDMAGEWELGCFVFLSTENSEENPGPTHYDVGMKLPIVVTAAMNM